MTRTDYYLQHPRNQLFYKVLGTISTMLNTRCNSWWDLKIPRYVSSFCNVNRWMVLTFAKAVAISQIIFLILNFRTIDPHELIIAMALTPVGILSTTKVQLGKLKSFKILMENFMDKIHIYNSYLRDQSDYVKTKVVQIERLSRFTAYFLHTFCFICWFSWMMTPTIYNIRNIDAIMNKTTNFHYYLYLWVPFDYKYSLRNFICLYILYVYIGITGVAVLCSFDAINFMIIYHFVGHIYILKYNLRANWSDEFNEQETKQFLVDNIKYHSFIIRTFKKIQAAFGINVAGNYLQNLIEDGLFLHQLLLGDKESVLIYGLMMVLYLGGLLLISVVLEEIRRQNVDLSDYVYALPWHRMSITNQKLVILLLGRTQPDLEFRAACGMKAGVQPAISIIKSMFSYYVMIKARME